MRCTAHFTGKERDTETGLDYFEARYYGSNMGRWMSPDWAGKPAAVPYADFGDPQTLNLYGYVRNNPLWKADLDGHGWWQDLKTAARNTVDNIGIGFLTLVLQPDQAVKVLADLSKPLPRHTARKRVVNNSSRASREKS